MRYLVPSLAYPIIGFVVLSVLCTAMTMYLWGNRVMGENIKSTNRHHARDQYALISDYIRNETRTMLRLARVYRESGQVIRETAHFIDSGGFDAHADHLPLKRVLVRLGIWDHMDDILVTDLEGRVMAHARYGRRCEVLTGWGIEDAVRSGEIILTTRSKTGWEIRAILPVFRGQTPIGLMVIIKKINTAFAKKLSRHFDCQVSFAKPEGIVATSLPKESRIAPDREMILRVFRHMKVEQKDHDALSKTEFYVRLPIVDEDFCLIVVQDTSQSEILVRQTRKATLWLSIILIAVFSSIGLAFALGLIRPLQKLKERARDMAREYTGQELSEVPGNEVINLVHGFNSMADAIQRHIEYRKSMEAELERHRHRLEELVAKRTAGLNRANASLQGEIRQRIRTEKNLLENKVKLETALSELKLTQAKMIQSEKMASVGQLAAGVAHEINNPTGFVKSNLSTLLDYQTHIAYLLEAYADVLALLEETMADAPALTGLSGAVDRINRMVTDADLDYLMEDIPDLIKESLEGVERIQGIVSALKDFSHPGHKEAMPADINQCLRSSLKVIWNELKHKAEVIEDYGKLPMVTCDAQQIIQVFVNLLMNAAQAIEDKGEIRITTRADGENVEIRISDTGTGISEKNISQIFDPFFTTKQIGQGTGLGLHVVWDIIQAQGGQIKVKSTEGKGTTFYIHLKQPPEPPDIQAVNGQKEVKNKK